MNAPPARRPDGPTPQKGQTLAEEIGARLRAARLDADLSQAQLGKLLRTRSDTPVAPAKISSYERGVYIPEPRLRPQLARALKVPEEELFGAVEAGLAEREPAVTLSYAVLSNRMERVEAELESLRQRVETQGEALRKQLDAADAADLERALEAGDVRDRESKRPSQKPPKRRPS